MATATFWDNAAEKYAKDPISDMEGYTKTLDIIKGHLEPQHRVLELGCGTGSTALELAPLVDRYTGTDISPNMIAIANKKRADASFDNLRFDVAKADQLPETQNDVILALNLLHLVPNVEETLRLIYDALPPGGHFIAKTGMLRDGAWYLTPMIALMRVVGKAPYVKRLSEEDFKAMLWDTGFRLTETITQPGIAPRLFTVAQKPD